MLYQPGEEATCVESVWQAVGLMAWDHLELLDLPEGTPLLRTQSVPRNAQRFSRGRCPVADLAGGFEAYIGSQSANTRRQARKYLRAAARHDAVFELATQADTVRFFDDLIRLHQERWTAEAKPGCFSAARFTEFHRGLVRDWVPSGRAVLARLSHTGHVYAVLYGFINRSTFEFYQSGVRLGATGPLQSPGNLTHLLLMRALADRGVTEYDFLRGSASYKERLATRENHLIGVQIWRPTLRTVVHRSARFAERIVRKALHLVRRPSS